MNVIDYDYFRNVTDGTSCVYYGDIHPRHMPAQDYVQATRQAYGGGAAGLDFWDSDRRIMLRLIDDWNPSGFT